MIKNELLFQLLQISVDQRSALDRIPTKEEWEWLFETCFSRGLVGMGFKAIEKLPKEQQPDIYQKLHWTGQADIIRKENETANRLCNKVVYILGKHHLNPIILKGQSLAKKYNNPLYRKTGDIDVWCGPDEGARELGNSGIREFGNEGIREFGNSGTREFGNSGIREFGNLAWNRKRIMQILRPYITAKQAKHVFYHHMEFTSIEGTQVEVHFTPTWMFNPVHNRRFQKFAEEYRKIIKGQGHFDSNTFADEGRIKMHQSLTDFDVVFVLMHMYRHLFAEGANLRQLMDYFFVLKEYNDKRSLDGNDNKKPQTLLKRMGLYKFAGAVEYALQQVYAMPDEWLIVPVNERAGKVLLNDLLYNKTSHDLHDKAFRRFLHYQWHMLQYYFIYPQEALWAIPFKFGQWVWRKWKGFR